MAFEDSDLAEEIHELTDLLRVDPGWSGLRTALHNKGLSIDTTLLATYCEDGDGHEYGVVVTQDKMIFEFSGSPTNTNLRDAQLLEWKDRTNDESFATECPQVRVALTLLP